MAHGLLSTRYRTECGGHGTAEYPHMSHSNGSITSMIGQQTSEEDSLWLVGLNFFPVVGYPPRDNTNVGCIYPPLETRSITLFFLQVCLSGLQFFHGSITFEPWRRVWRSWAPAKCKIFLWMPIRNRCCTTDRLTRRGLPHPSHCPFCDQEEENIQHLLTTCVLARDFWYQILSVLGLQD